MSILNFILIIAIIDIVIGVFILIKEDIGFVPKKLYGKLKDENKKEFTQYFGKGLTITGLAILIAGVSIFSEVIIRWTLFGFTLAYSDMYFKKARKLVIQDNIAMAEVNTDTVIKKYKSKKSGLFASVSVLGLFILGVFLVNSFNAVVNSNDFENNIDTNEVMLATVYIAPTKQDMTLNENQIENFVEIFNDMIIYEEITTESIIADAITYNIIMTDGTVFEVKIVGDLLIIRINGVLYRYTIDTLSGEKLNYLTKDLINN